MKNNTKKSLKIALILGLIVAPNLLFGAGFEEFLEKSKILVSKVEMTSPM